MRRTRVVPISVLAVLLGIVPATDAAVAMLGSTGGTSVLTPTPGSVFTIDQTNGAGVYLDTPLFGAGIAGLATNAAGRVYAVTSILASSGRSHLIELDPITGELIADLGGLVDKAGNDCAIGDLSFQPGTDVLFAIAANNGTVPRCGIGILTGGYLLTIDISTVTYTVVGRDPSSGNNNGGLAFAPDGTLYFSGAWVTPGVLHTMDPATGNFITATPTESGEGYLGLAVRPTDGVIFASHRFDSSTTGVWTIDPTSGVETPVGDPGELIHDLTFVAMTAVPAQSSGALLFMGVLLALTLAGATTASVLRRSRH